jgi:hypothetical protein
MVKPEYIADLARLLEAADLHQLMVAMIAQRVDGPEPRYGADLLAMAEACAAYEAIEATQAAAPDQSDPAPVHPKSLLNRIALGICNTRVAMAPDACAADRSGRCPTCQTEARNVLGM